MTTSETVASGPEAVAAALADAQAASMAIRLAQLRAIVRNVMQIPETSSEAPDLVLCNNITYSKKRVARNHLPPQDFGHETACAHSPVRQLEPRALRQALAQAEERCRTRGERWTASRRRVMELLLKAGGPMKAYDLMAAFGDSGAPAKPPTVYRALEFLEQLGLAHRIAGINAFIACGVEQAVHTAAFLICDCCGSAEEFDPQTEAVTATAAEHGFKIEGVALEVRGRCRWCSTEHEH